MPIRPDEPLRKVTLNLYESDCQWLEQTYGHGWSERLRQHIHNEINKRRHDPDNNVEIGNVAFVLKRRTLGDLADD